jgi:hypothetical protein
VHPRSGPPVVHPHGPAVLHHADWGPPRRIPARHMERRPSSSSAGWCVWERKMEEEEDKVASIFVLDPEKMISSQISPRMEYRSPVLATLLEKSTLWYLNFSLFRT